MNSVRSLEFPTYFFISVTTWKEKYEKRNNIIIIYIHVLF